MTTLSKKVLEKYKNSVFVETGTLWGESVQLALDCGFTKVYTIELDPEKVKFNRNKFKEEIENGVVEIIEGDTFKVFSDVINNITSRATFWLDAHWDEGPVGEYKCPLPFELKNLLNHSIKNHTLLIDDRRIFGEVGSTWGEGIDESEIIDLIHEINPEYEISYEDGCIPNDIIVAEIKE
jgi:asparagine synthetase B (glutamine-hydrolysing)